MDIKRNIEKSIRVYLSKYPIIGVTGPRQSGKTTMLKTMFPDYTYVNLESFDARNFAESDPRGFLNHYNNKVIFDEAQRVPQLFSYLQAIVDDDTQMGRFILSGSQNFHLMTSITQSLAGRIALFRLMPLDLSEMKRANLLDEDYAKMIIRGFYPALYDRDIDSKTFFSNYIETYVERDIRDLVNVQDLRLFRNFIGLCAARAGQLLNLNSLANECGISQPTAKSWLSVLQASYVVFLLNPYFKNYSKRITKTPKLYFYDTGLLAHLLKVRNPDKLKLSPVKGNLFENLIVSELLKQNYHQQLHREMWFWRDASGHEVDLILQDDEQVDILEMKATETVMGDLFSGLNFYADLAGEDIKSKTLVYGGNQNQVRSNVNVVGWQSLADELFLNHSN